MKKILIVFILWGLMFAPNAGADINAGVLLQLCKREETHRTDFAFCLGYVTGFMSSIDITANKSNLRVEPNYNLYFDLMKPCMPRRTIVADIVGLILRYFEKWESKANEPASLVLMEALHDRYPCDNGI